MVRLQTRFLLVLALVGLPVPALAPCTDAHADEPVHVGLSGVAAIVRHGNDEAALAELGRLPERVRQSTTARYLEGRLAERTARLERAAAAFEAATGGGLPAFAERDARARRARLLARIGRCADARPLLLEEGSVRSRAIAGECALVEGRVDDAIALLEPIDRESPDPVDAASVRLALAQAIDRKGDRARAVAMLRAMWLERPTHRDRPSLEAALRALDANALVLTEAEREAQVNAFVAVGAFTQARRALEALAPPPTREALVVRRRSIAEFAMRARDYPAAAEAYERTFEASHDDADSFERARALVRAGSHTRALPILDGVARAHAHETLGDDALFLAADVALGLEDPSRAIAFVTSHRGENADELRVGLVLHGLLKGDAALAERYVDAVVRVRDSYKEERSRYLRARVLELKRDFASASSTYQAIIQASPFGYYGLASAVRLRALGTEVPVPTLSIGERPTSAPLPEDVAFFHALGLEDEARAALRRAEGSLRSSLGVPGIVAMHLGIDSYARAYALARTEVVVGRTVLDDRTRPLFHAAYPRPYETEVNTTTRLLGIRPAHVYGTMRQESAYDPDARSQVGALGLLQVMPGTARRVANDLGLSPRSLDPFDPHTNVRLGIGEMATLATRFGSQLPLVIAAYNAGTSRVIRWLPPGRHMPSDLFIERIPYDETRGYVRRVLGHFAVYCALEGTPEDILAGLSVEVVGH